MVQWVALIVVAVVGVLAAALPDIQLLAELPAYLIALATLAILILVYLVTSVSSPPSDGPPWRRRLALLAIGCITVAAISLSRHDGTVAVDNPEQIAVGATAQRQGPVSVRIRKGDDGRFQTSARINGATIPVVVDSGASAVLLRHSDAVRAGIDVKGLTFDSPVATANGTTYAAAVRLRSIQIGLISIADVDALVARPGTLTDSLLGMSFLTRLASHVVAGEFMTLRN